LEGEMMIKLKRIESGSYETFDGLYSIIRHESYPSWINPTVWIIREKYSKKYATCNSFMDAKKTLTGYLGRKNNV
jgi:hypothetical protein